MKMIIALVGLATLSGCIAWEKERIVQQPIVERQTIVERQAPAPAQAPSTTIVVPSSSY
jgi:hypothetical protein